jgi:hypothetical protein
MTGLEKRNGIPTGVQYALPEILNKNTNLHEIKSLSFRAKDYTIWLVFFM